MNYNIKKSSFTRQNITDVERLSMYIPPRLVLSSQISRKNLNRNSEETDIEEYEKHDDVDEFFQNLSEQMQEKLKENKDKLKSNKLFTKKRKNFVGEFLEVKKSFEADFAANTRIYQNSSNSFTKCEKIRDVNNKEYTLQMSSADKYVALLQSRKTAQSGSLNKVINKYYSLQPQTWVPGAVMSKIKIDSDRNSSDSGGSIKNQEQELLQNANVNDQVKTMSDKVKNGQLYGFTYKPVQASKKIKIKKKSFIEEFSELKNKLGVTSKTKTKNHEENSELLNTENKKEKETDSSLKQKQITKNIKNKIITPFGSIRTSFFNSYNPLKTPKPNRRIRSNAREDITADWVKGDLIQRRENLTHNFIDSKNREQTPESICKSEHLQCDHISSSYIWQSNKSFENNSELCFTPRNEYSRVSPSYTPLNDTPGCRKNEQVFENHCTSTITMSTLQYSKNIDMHRPNFVITETKVTKLMFPSHQMNLFQHLRSTSVIENMNVDHQ